MKPNIYRVDIGNDRDQTLRKLFLRWGWHNARELIACVNEHLVPYFGHPAWGARPLTLFEFIKGFSVLGGHRSEGAEVVTLLTWASPFSCALDSPPLQSPSLDMARNDPNTLYFPAAWGLKALKLIEAGIIAVLFVPPSSLKGERLVSSPCRTEMVELSLSYLK